MAADEVLLFEIRKLIEAKINWGDSREWTNQDFVALSEKIQEEVNISLSHVTLKRIWGKVKYESLPNNHTLNTLARFVGFENWREFKLQMDRKDASQPAVLFAGEQERNPLVSIQGNKAVFKIVDIVATVFLLVSCVTLFVQAKKWQLNPDDYSFSSKKVVSIGVPNSVIFDYDASKSPTDAVIIQQSWDQRLRTTVSKNDHQHTSIYYFPDFYRAKLIVGNQIVQEHELFIQSDGWLAAVDTSPVPVYFKNEDVMVDGKMSLSLEKIKAQNIPLQPAIRSTLFGNVRDFGEIFTDDFVFETTVRNDYREGSSVCQKTNIYLLADEAPIGIPLCSKGCVSDIEFIFAGTYLSGKKKDLSAFGRDISNFTRVTIKSAGGIGKIFLNDSLSYEVPVLKKSKIIGIYFIFAGAGSVDYVKLGNDQVMFEDQF